MGCVLVFTNYFVEKQGRRPSWLAQQLHTVRSNVYSIYRRESIYTELLQRISVILGHNFLQDLAQETHHQITPSSSQPSSAS